ncbi:MAG: alpha-L-arabinofuranosidase [Verrucomicrobiae bacterium]|nr:alpha-L-arabinofuranosidase [Verrucomicrobiae bacterium]
MNIRFHMIGLVAPLLLVFAVQSGLAQANLPIYTDRLVNGFQDWSWGSRNLTNTAPVRSGTRSISATFSAWQGLSFHHAEFSVVPYAAFAFWANGGAAGGQILRVYAEYGTNRTAGVQLAPLPTNAWRQYVIPLADLGVADVTNLHRLTLQLTSFGTTGTWFVDDIELISKPAPAVVNISVNSLTALRTVDARWFGVNTAIWDDYLGDDITERTQTISLLTEMGTTTLRFPGGSISDEYHWATGTTLTNTWRWNTTFTEFAMIATNIRAHVFITVNYGTGTPEEAAAWVRHSNLTNNYGFKYWEIGNECYGPWETDSNTYPHDPFTYATRAKAYIEQMKAADPTIKVGVVAVPGENSFSNQYTALRPVVNPRTGQTNYGWTPIMLATLKSLGVKPDFLVHHHYPQWTPENPTHCPVSDPFLLQSAVNWASDAADLRQQIIDYYGPGGEDIELVVTENNCDAGAQGRQSTSLVNALYYADSLGQLAKTEFNAFVWWDLRNGTDTKGCFDPTLYGWRNYGDLGMINGPTNRHPVFYGAKMMSHLMRAGDDVLEATSDYPLLAAYAARKPSGALALLVINKDSVTTLVARITLNDFIPHAVAQVRFYGIPQDEAARTNAHISKQDISLTNAPVGQTFTHLFPPYSLTLFTFAPAPARLEPVHATADQFVFRIYGQQRTRYVIESSPDLTTWTPVSTNSLAGPTLTLTNTINPNEPQQFWRAVWRP